MAKQIFVNLPVKDLEKSIAFFSKLGFTFDPKFTDEKATCMVVSDTIYVMLLAEKFFRTFTKKPITDAKNNTEAIIALSADSREEVDDIIKKAVAAGGHSPKEASDDGWMYGRGFEDLDGHLWEILHMDQDAMIN